MRLWLRPVLGLAVVAAAIGAMPAGAMAGSISGTVTAEDGGAPIQGVQVCARREPYTVETDCAFTNGSGAYSLAGLPAGDYGLSFSTELDNLKYVGESYDDKPLFGEADLVHVEASQNLTGLDVQLAEGGSISGVVTAEGSGAPISGLWVCALAPGGIPGRCSRSEPDGAYRLNGLPDGSFEIEFEGGNTVNYLHEFYDDAGSLAAAKSVEVTAPNLTSGIDAVLSPGAEILGRVNEVGSGDPISGVTVCTEAQGSEYENCTATDASGAYALRSLPAGAYIVGFGIEYLPFFGRVAAQWWRGASSRAAATPIEIAPPEARAGIDAQLANPYPPREQGGDEPPSPPPPPPPPKPVGAPNTRLLRARILPRRGVARFFFRAVGRATGFECALVRRSAKRRKRARFRPCRSPKTYRRLRPGRYLFAVRAKGPGGRDARPAKRRFAIKRKPRRRRGRRRAQTSSQVPFGPRLLTGVSPIRL